MADTVFPIDHAKLLVVLKHNVKQSGGPSNGGLDNHMWAAVVDRTGIVRAVCYSGKEVGDQWPPAGPLQFPRHKLQMR